MENASTLRHLGQHLSDVEIGKVLGLAKVELSQREIANLMNCSKKAVQHTIETYNFDTFQGRNLHREYERKTTKHEDRYIERALKQNNSLPLHDITNIMGLPVSHWTVTRHRSEIGLGSNIAANKPGLHNVNVEKRLEWAMKYKNWTVDD